MTEHLSLFGDPAAAEIARQGMATRDQLWRADNRVAEVAAEWRDVCDRLVRERDNALARLSARIANYNQLVADFNALLESANRLEANRDEWKAFALKMKDAAIRLEDEVARLKAERESTGS